MIVRASSPVARVTRGVGHASGRRHHELVGRQHELRRRAGAGPGVRRREESLAAPPLGPERRVRIERVDGLPRLGRGDERAHAARLERHAEIARAPEVPGRFVAAAPLRVIQDVLDRVARDAERGGRAVCPETQPREVRASEELVAVAQDREPVGKDEGIAHRALMRAEVDRRPHHETDRPRSGEESIADVDRVLAVRDEEPLLQDEPAQLVSPDGKPQLEAELDQVQHVSGLVGSGGLPALGRGGHAPVRQAEPLVQVTQHVHAAERRREGGDQESVVPPCHQRGHRARRVAAESIRDEPLGGRQPAPLGIVATGPRDPPDQIGHREDPKTRVVWPGRSQPSAGSNSGVPAPP